MIETQLLEQLEAGLHQLAIAVLKLPPGDDKIDTLRAIANFRQRISDLKQVARERRRGGPIADDQTLSPLRLSDQAAPPTQMETADTEKLITALTRRERQIMLLVSEGLSNKQIGRRLNIADGTIKVHLHNIFQKLEVRNRTVLAGLATQLPSASEPPEGVDELGDAMGANEE